MATKKQATQVLGLKIVYLYGDGKDAHAHIAEELGEAVVSEHSFCFKSKYEIRTEGLTLDTDKAKAKLIQVDERPNIPLCDVCLEKWKKHPRGPYSKWLKAVAGTNGKP
jgi:hypothetical protein